MADNLVRATSQAATNDVWAKVVDSIKQSIIAPSLWRALEKTIAVVYEENNFVIGFATVDGTAANQLNSTEYRYTIERTLRQMTGNADLRLRVIEGNEYGDWEQEKRREAVGVQQQAAQMQKQVSETKSFGTWDELYEQVSRLWANSESRSLPTGRARYLIAATDLVLDAMVAIYPATGVGNEQTERGLSRVVERIASMTNSDAVMVAHLLFERRGQRTVIDAA